MSQTVLARDGDTGRPAEEGGVFLSPAPLSELHAMLGQVERETHPHHLNRLLNDSSIDPWVRGYTLGKLDATKMLADPKVTVLGGEYGALVFRQVMPGLYEVHVQCLPEGRGPWMESFSRAALHWMMTRSDMIEAAGPVPRGNPALRTWAKRMGFKRRFGNPQGWVYDLDPVPTDIVSILLQDWIDTAPGLVERGRWFLEHFNRELKRLGKEMPTLHDDEERYRFIGLMAEMLFGNMPMKALIFYNRWASFAGQPIMSIVTMNPLLIEIAGAQIVIRAETQSFWVAAVVEKEGRPDRAA